MKNSADQGGCYPQRPKAEVDNTLRDLQNSVYPTKAEFNNYFIIHSKYFLLLKGVSPFRSLFFRSPNITQPCPQVFSVNGSIICGGIIMLIIIHSKYFPVSDWSKPHASFTMTSCCSPNLEKIFAILNQ